MSKLSCIDLPASASAGSSTLWRTVCACFPQELLNAGCVRRAASPSTPPTSPHSACPPPSSTTRPASSRRRLRVLPSLPPASTLCHRCLLTPSQTPEGCCLCHLHHCTCLCRGLQTGPSALLAGHAVRAHCRHKGLCLRHTAVDKPAATLLSVLCRHTLSKCACAIRVQHNGAF